MVNNMKKKTTWLEKLNDKKDLPKVVRFDASKGKNWPPGTYVIPAPIEVDEIMNKVTLGKLITIDQIRNGFRRSALPEPHSISPLPSRP
jgi:hypothetical protein